MGNMSQSVAEVGTRALVSWNNEFKQFLQGLGGAATPAEPLTYTALKAAAALALARRHGIKTNVGEKRWRDWFIKGMAPADAADRAAGDYQAMRPPLVARSGRRKG